MLVRRELIIAAIAVAIIAAAIAVGGRKEQRMAPPAPATSSTSTPSPRVTPGVTLRGAGAGAGAGAAGADGALALRAQADDFVAQQAAAVEEHMRREGLTLDETRELTYFGILAVQSQDWARIEALTGAPLADDARRAAWEAMMARSQEMRRELQELVAAGAGEDARWDAIARIEDAYLADYYRITGMTPALLDALLAAAVREQRAADTIAGLAPDAEPPHPAGARGTWVRRDPAHPDRPPVPIDEQPPP